MEPTVGFKHASHVEQRLRPIVIMTSCKYSITVVALFATVTETIPAQKQITSILRVFVTPLAVRLTPNKWLAFMFLGKPDKTQR